MPSRPRSIVSGTWMGPLAILLALCLAWVVAGHVPWPFLGAWLLALAAVHGWHIYQGGRASVPGPADWLKAPVFPLGLVWGSAIFFLPALPADERLEVVCLVLAVDAVARTVIRVYSRRPKWHAFPAGVMAMAALPSIWLDHGIRVTLAIVLALLLAAALRQMLGFLVGYGFMLASHNDELRRELGQAVASLEESNRNKTHLLTTASHDLRQPVHSLGLLLEELTPDVDRLELKDRLVLIRSVVHGLADSLNVLMNAACLEAGMVRPDIGAVALQPLLSNLYAEFKPFARAKNLAFTLEAENVWVSSDPLLLTRIVSNLISNAIRYTATGQVAIQASRSGDLVDIQVVDTGRGISEERLVRIFDENQRIDVMDRLRGGIGLGLSIVRRQAELLGHAVSAHSTLGAGSRFTIRVQACEPAEGHRTMPSPLSLDAAHSASRVLLLDDDPVVLRGMVQLVAGLGCQPVPIHDHRAWLATECDEDSAVDVIVADYHIGSEATGLDVIRRSWRRQDRRVPAILLTGDINAELAQLAREEGIVLLYKPIRPTQMKEALIKALG